MTKNEEKTVEVKAIFESGFNCCQAVFTPFAAEHGLHEEISLRISSGFAAGLCFQGKTCGAVVGAQMALGLFNGYSSPDDEANKNKIKEAIAEYNQKFIERHGSTLCKELLDADPSNEEELAYLREKGVFRQKCPGFVADSVKIIEEIINNE